MRLVAIFVFLWAGCVDAAVEAGHYAVGFRSQYQWDATRQYSPPYVPGSPHSHVKKARPIFIAMWYPAQRSDSARMIYRDYLASYSGDPEMADFSKRLMRFMRGVVHEDAFGQGPEDSAFESFLDSATTAVRNANPAAGRFPVIIYHSGLGGSFEDNSLLFEMLASHGFVVINSGYENADASTFNINGDLVTSLRDMEFLLRFAAGLPFADTKRIGAMGHSYGAQAAMDWLAEPNSPVDAVVSLDSTVENVGLDRFVALNERIKKMANSDVPVLEFASRKHQPKFATYDEYLKCNPRFQVTVDYVEHNDYLTHGTVSRGSGDAEQL